MKNGVRFTLPRQKRCPVQFQSAIAAGLSALTTRRTITRMTGKSVRDWIDRDYALFKPAYLDPILRRIGRDGDAAIATGQPAGSSSIGYRERLCNRRRWGSGHDSDS
ncbi:hypothetical protein [Rhodanobacter terrae]|uniref:Uncharacterized protein n=1 Tax=Rhodanobacter terrae TaxID=418647 RepID=A0ABW0T269_9GAMM